MIIRLLLGIAVLWVVFMLMTRFRRTIADRRAKTKVGGRMVSCSECGVFLPQTQAHEIAPGQYRCEQHLTG